jgi:hypothetical protein
MNCNLPSEALRQQYCGLAYHSHSLPFTGANIAAMVVLALLLISIGVALRYRAG